MLGRLIVAILGIPVLMWIMLKGEISLILFVELIIGTALYEFYKMLEEGKESINVSKKIGIVMGLTIPILQVTLQKSQALSSKTIILGIVVSLIVFMSYQVFLGKIKNALENASYTLFGVLYIGVMFSHILLIKDLNAGRLWLLTVFLLMWASDSAAYFVGINIGKHKLAPKISPKKSIEGAIGGLVAPILSMLLLKYVLYFPNIEIIHCFGIGILVGVFGQIGDLSESLLKREFGIKDSSKILLGHGGVLDRFDSLLFVAPALYYYILIFGV